MATQHEFYFAWITEDEVFNPLIHNREDEDIYTADYDQSEGDFAGMTIVVRNPRIGLLNVSRKTWIYFSFREGNTITPIFKGRLVTIPTNVFETYVTLEFTAKPSNFVAQKTALATAMKILPYWEPVVISPDSWSDPDAVLEAYSKLWHIDPVTNVVSASDVIVPEDGTEIITEDQHYADDMQLTLNQTPLRRVTVIATIPWTQTAAGGLDLTPKIKELFGTAIPTSFTMAGLISSWPKPGANFSNGWQVLSASMSDVSYAQDMIPIPDIFSWDAAIPDIPAGSVVFPMKTTGIYYSGEDKAGFDLQYEIVAAAIGYGVPDLQVTFSAGREFSEVISFTLETDQQAIATDPGEDEAQVITLNGNKVTDPTEDGSIPMYDSRARVYAHTARGRQTCEHCLLIGRAALIMRSRCVETTVEVGWIEGLRLRSLRKGALIQNRNIPGGQAEGKIIHVKGHVDADSGDANWQITIGSTVGYGGDHTTSQGTPTYADEGLFDDTQEYANQIVLTGTSDIAWSLPPPATSDDGLDFIAGLNISNAILQASLQNSAADQRAAILAVSDGPNTDQAKISSVLGAMPTQITMQLVPMDGGPFQKEVVLSVSDLIVPKQIDMEAPSNA